MQAFRRYLGWVVCGWLACQIAGVAAAPVLLVTAAAAHDERECDCPLLPGQACPMHHNGKHDNTTCRMRNGFDGDAALFSLTGGFGVLPELTAAVSSFDPGAIVLPSTPFSLVRPSLPEAPPPRA
jgi:hypothetical protein